MRRKPRHHSRTHQHTVRNHRVHYFYEIKYFHRPEFAIECPVLRNLFTPCKKALHFTLRPSLATFRDYPGYPALSCLRSSAASSQPIRQEKCRVKILQEICSFHRTVLGSAAPWQAIPQFSDISGSIKPEKGPR